MANKCQLLIFRKKDFFFLDFFEMRVMSKVYQEQVLESVNYIERTSLIKMHFSKIFQNIKLTNRRGH